MNECRIRKIFVESVYVWVRARGAAIAPWWYGLCSHIKSTITSIKRDKTVQKKVWKMEKHEIDGCTSTVFFLPSVKYMQNLPNFFTVSLFRLHPFCITYRNLVIILMFMCTAMVTFEYSACVCARAYVHHSIHGRFFLCVLRVWIGNLFRIHSLSNRINFDSCRKKKKFVVFFLHPSEGILAIFRRLFANWIRSLGCSSHRQPFRHNTKCLILLLYNGKCWNSQESVA